MTWYWTAVEDCSGLEITLLMNNDEIQQSVMGRRKNSLEDVQGDDFGSCFWGGSQNEDLNEESGEDLQTLYFNTAGLRIPHSWWKKKHIVKCGSFYTNYNTKHIFLKKTK